MPRLFGDEQISRRRFLLWLALIGGAVLANAVLGVAPDQMAINLAVLLSAQAIR